MKPNQLQKRNIKSEADVVKKIVSFLGDQNYKVQLEVPNMGQSADIVATHDHFFTFIEAKMSDWQRALNQCKTHRHVADYICIAVGTVSVSNALLEKAINLGYGIIHCEPFIGYCQWILKPHLNDKIWPPQRQRLENHLKDIEYAC